MKSRVTATPCKHGLWTINEDVTKKEGARWNREIGHRLD
jgi:hypothetical protein